MPLEADNLNPNTGGRNYTIDGKVSAESIPSSVFALRSPQTSAA